MTGAMTATKAVGVKETRAFKWYKAIRIDLHADKWPAAFENAVRWTDTAVVTVATPLVGPVEDIVLIFSRERVATREPHAIQMTLDEATELLGELDAHVNPGAEFAPQGVALIMRNDDGAMAGIKMDMDEARNFTILLWSLVDQLTPNPVASTIIQ